MSTPVHQKLEVMAEYCSSGIWAIGQHGPFRHAMVSHEALGLPPDLATQFRCWIDRYWALAKPQPGAPFDFKAFNAEGERLTAQLQAFLGSRYQVAYTPEDESD